MKNYKSYKEEISYLEMIKDSILSKNKPSLMDKHFLVCTNCDSTINNKYIKKYDCPVCKAKNVFMTEIVKNNVLLLDEEIEKIKQEILKNRKPIKITKNKHYRINFVYENKHYSLTNLEDSYDDKTYLLCKEDKNNFIVVNKENVIHKYRPLLKQGQTYKHSDWSKLYEIIEEFIEGVI